MSALPLTAESQRSRRLLLAGVFASSLGVGLVFGFEPPLIALVLARAGHSAFASGAVTASSLIAIIVAGPFYPRLLARLGLKRGVVWGVVCAALLLLLMPLWPGVLAWFVFRVLTGGALGLSWIASEVWLNSVSDVTSRGTLMGIYGAVFSSGTMAGPLLLDLTGTSGWPPFLIGSAGLLLTLLPLLLLRQAESAPQVFTPIRELGGAIRAAPVIMLAALVAGLVESAELALLPLLGVHAGLNDRSALLLLTVYMSGNVVLQTPIGLLADRFGRRRLLALCAGASAVGPLLLLPWIHRPLLLWPLLFLWGGTLFAFYGQGIALLGAAFSPAQLPSANTVFVMVYCFGGVIGPSVGGVFMDRWPTYGLQTLLCAAALALLLALAAGGLRRGPCTMAPTIQ